MTFDGAFGDAEFARDLCVGVWGEHQAQHLGSILGELSRQMMEQIRNRFPECCMAALDLFKPIPLDYYVPHLGQPTKGKFASLCFSDSGETCAEKATAFRDRYAHGISALTRVPFPGGVQTRRRPPSASKYAVATCFALRLVLAAAGLTRRKLAEIDVRRGSATGWLGERGLELLLLAVCLVEVLDQLHVTHVGFEHRGILLRQG